MLTKYVLYGGAIFIVTRNLITFISLWALGLLRDFYNLQQITFVSSGWMLIFIVL